MRSIIALIVLLSVSIQAKAYDIDTHFYATYAMARHAGIRDEVAQKIALSAQWMDESFISDPTSLMFLGLTGIKKRRLLHFPADRYVGDLNGYIEQHAVGNFGFSDLPVPWQVAATGIMKTVDFDPKNFDRMTVFSETEKDHRLATELLMQGLQHGDLLQASASLHTLEDSYAHAGTPAGEGHRGAWHWPDRPYSNPTKYFEMTRSVFQALAAIRLMLPESALDCSLQTTRLGTPNCTTTAEELQTSWVQNLAVQHAVRYNVLQDATYVRESLKSLFKIAAHPRIGYVTMSDADIDKMLDEAKIDGNTTAAETLAEIITTLTKRYMAGDPALLVKKTIIDVYQLKNPTDDDLRIFIRNYGTDDDHGHLSGYDSAAFKNFVADFSKKLLRTFVPRELNNDDHRQEVELDNDIALTKGKVIKAPRTIEMEIRVAKMQELIQRLYGNKIVMVENNTKDDVGFAHEIWMRADAQPVIPGNASPDTQFVTFSLEEKHRFDMTIFHYLFPSMTDADLLTMVDIGAILKGVIENVKGATKTLSDGHPTWIPLPVEFTGQLMQNSLEINKSITMGTPLAARWVHDLLHETENTTFNYNYHSVNFLKQYKDSGVLLTFLGDKDTWNSRLAVNQNYQPKKLTSVEPQK